MLSHIFHERHIPLWTLCTYTYNIFIYKMLDDYTYHVLKSLEFHNLIIYNFYKYIHGIPIYFRISFKTFYITIFSVIARWIFDSLCVFGCHISVQQTLWVIKYANFSVSTNNLFQKQNEKKKFIYNKNNHKTFHVSTTTTHRSQKKQFLQNIGIIFFSFRYA